MDLDKLKFDQNGLIPAIVVDEVTKDVLTLAYMNRESLEISLREGTTCFYSRSRQTLWRKGETSGNVQHIVSITADCDCDALKIVVKKDGPACHTGSDAVSFTPSTAALRCRSFLWRAYTRFCRAKRKRCLRVPTPATCLKRVWIRS